MQRFFSWFFGLLILSATLGGCNLFSSPPPKPKEQITQTANDFVEVTRTFLSPVKAGQEITVQIKITAKVDLRAVLLSETLPQGWQLAEGSQNRTAQLGLKAGESLEHSYTIKVGGVTGTAKLRGMVTVATSQGAQEPLELESEISVR